ncbi:hypothetical protein PDG61_10055 [Mycolicibacterium sp. BiH015]|uniref:hypothetical protein n=1 Tax=Mycolicibacterium sp. BiH015 TaxID=3018808 RepID=UPI0022E86654|nr:hypothetical protein [Mycolicibacterium sp. BiH015]MDA2891255.1 hypothetical protein [Mycolicibacterium sp. BiH015]
MRRAAALLHRFGGRPCGVLNAIPLLLLGGYVVSVLYLCVLALEPTVSTHLPAQIRWFGESGSHETIVVVLGLPLLHFVLRRLTGRTALSGPPLVIIAAMAASALALGLSAYWRCHGDQAPFFAPLSWTLALFAGNVEQPFGAGNTAVCASMPVALEIGRLLAIATTLAAAMAAALALFRSQLDRIAIWRAPSLTVVIGLDDDTVSFVRAVVRTANPTEAVVVLVDNVAVDSAHIARSLGAKVRAVNFAEPESISRLPFWGRLRRLYLLTADPVANLKLFEIIDEKAGRARDAAVRLPLIVRIDDPWQAEVWRRSFLATSDRCWVADAVGRYELTAARLVRHMSTGAGAGRADPPTAVMLCGLYPLTYALASELAQLHREQSLYPKPGVKPPAEVVIFARGAQSFVDDHHLRQSRMTIEGVTLSVTARDEAPTVDAISNYFRSVDARGYAVVLGDPSMATQGTRLAARYPTLRVYAASAASASLDLSIVGRLYNFPIDMEIDPDAPQDVWERAAELIHEQYSSGTNRDTPATKPWNELDGFIKQSNRRQLLHALWMVETIAGHTWNSLERLGSTQPLPAGFASMKPLEQLAVLGFEKATVDDMVRAEHEDWRRYYEAAGWRYDEVRADDRRRHNKLLPWQTLIERDPTSVLGAYRSLAGTLINLHHLGYRSVPKTPPGSPEDTGEDGFALYRRRGEVTARQQDQDWTWTAPNGEVMKARAGDWAVVDDHGVQRSVAAEVFESMHRQIGPARYQRLGTVLARRVTAPENVETLEGTVVANTGDWILRGPKGEMWPVPDAQFRENYEGPLKS